MKSRPLIALVATTLISACVSMRPPDRPTYTGADTVTTAEPSQLVGSWQVRELNPIADAPEQRTTIIYQADGTVVGTVIPALEKGMEELGDMRFEISGDWTLTGDTVSHANVTIQESTGNRLGAMMSSLINRNNTAMAGSANIYELTTDRMVMVGTDGAAMEYVRIR